MSKGPDSTPTSFTIRERLRTFDESNSGVTELVDVLKRLSCSGLVIDSNRADRIPVQIATYNQGRNLSVDEFSEKVWSQVHRVGNLRLFPPLGDP